MGAKDNGKKPLEDEEYIGNVFGWKYSYIGLGIILLFLGLMVVGLILNRGKERIPSDEQPVIMDSLEEKMPK